MSDSVNQIGRDLLSTLGHSGEAVNSGSAAYSSNTSGYAPGGYESYSTTTSQGGAGAYGAGGVSRIINTGAAYGASSGNVYDAGVSGGSSYGVTTSYGGGAADSEYSRVSTSYNRSNESSAAVGAVGTLVNDFISKTETQILNTAIPISSSENEEITVQGYRGVWLNKLEVDNWSKTSQIPITKYELNVDPNPEIITKRADQKVEYQQELAVRYLRPPTPPPPGELIIKEENIVTASSAPPIIIRQRPPRAPTPEPIIIREAPPNPPAAIGRKVVTIKKKQVTTTPRKLIVEKLPTLPSKPQSIIVEKWLPYRQQKRKVIYHKATDVAPVIAKQKNLIIQWELPAPLINKEYKYLGVINANPEEYRMRYGTLLKRSTELPSFVSEIKTPDTLLTTVDYKSQYELEGDLEALKLVDLDQEGLSEYKSFVHRFSFTPGGGNISSAGGASYSGSSTAGYSSSTSGGAGYSSNTYTSGGGSSNAYLESLIEEAFSAVDLDRSGSLDIDEANRLLLRLNSRLGRRYGEDEAKAFFAALDVNGDKKVELREFKRAFLKLN